jgi:UV DNA damage endonuclease
MTTKRVGFCCKWIDHPHQINGVGPKDDAKLYNTKTTTISWLNRQTREVAEQRLWDIMVYNIEALRLMVERVSGLEHNLRMCRLSSDILPGYTEPNWSYYYRRSDVRAYLERHFLRLGDLARSRDVRLSFHPGQFVCIVSDRPEVVNNSLLDLEYHTDMARYMGYGKSKLDFKINVHLSGRLGIEGFDAAWNRMSPELRNCLTLENDEYQTTIDQLIPLSHRVGLVLDVHHHWVTTGEYIESNDERIKKVIESWCHDGVDRRPVIHYSLSREDVLRDHSGEQRPDMASLIDFGHKRAHLRAHSDFMWNRAVNESVRPHWEWGDVMVEAKGKNLASFDLYRQWTNL